MRAPLTEVLAPFLAVARAIPPNWPGQCVLIMQHRPEKHGTLTLDYHVEGTVVGGITIDQWRSLLTAEAAIARVEQLARFGAETLRIIVEDECWSPNTIASISEAAGDLVVMDAHGMLRSSEEGDP